MVVAATRPRYCGILLVAALGLTAGLVCPAHVAAQKAKRTPPPPFAALFPLEEAWMITLPALPAAPAAREGSRMYVPLASGEVVALDWEHGDTLWSVRCAATSAPVAAGGVVYVGAGDTLHALDATSGAGRWMSHARGTLQYLALAGTHVLAVGAGFAHAFDAASGGELWSRTLPPAGDATGLVVSATTLFATYGDGRVVALALADGRDQWARPLEGRLSPPLLLGDALFVGSTEKQFHSLDARTGKVRWTWRTGGDVVGAAADGGANPKAVYYGSLDAVVRAVNPGNGHQRWKRDGGTRAVAPPLALDGSVLVAGLTPSLSGFAPLTGMPQGTFALPGEVHGTPLVSDALVPRTVAVVVVLKDGRAFGLRALSLMFNESAPQPLLTLPGKPLTRERLPSGS